MRSNGRNFRLLAWGACVGLVAAIICAGCARKPELRPEKIVVRVGYIPFNANLPFFVGLEKGYFAKHGVEIRAVKCADSSEALNAMLAGQVDMVAGLTFSIFFSAEQEAPGKFRLFLPFAETSKSPMSYLLRRNGAPIRTVKDLRGKKIGTYTGATQLLYLKLFLQRIGLDPDRDVTILQVSPTLQVQALAAKQFDALFTVEPYGTIAIQQRAGEVVLKNPRSQYILSPFWSGAAAVASGFWRDHREASRAAISAMDEAVDYVRRHPDQAKAVLPKYTPMDTRVAMASGLYEWYRADEDVDMKDIQKIADFMKEYGQLEKPMPVAPLFLTRREIE